MTTPQPEKKRLKVDNREDLSPRLVAALTLLDDLKAEEAAAKERAKDARRAIEAELQALSDPEDMPDAYDIPADPHGAWPAYTMVWHRPGWKIDEQRMQEEAPELYVEYAKPTNGYWEVRKATRGARRR